MLEFGVLGNFHESIRGETKYSRIPFPPRRQPSASSVEREIYSKKPKTISERSSGEQQTLGLVNFLCRLLLSIFLDCILHYQDLTS